MKQKVAGLAAHWLYIVHKGDVVALLGLVATAGLILLCDRRGSRRLSDSLRYLSFLCWFGAFVWWGLL